MTPRLFATNRLCERKDKRISPSNESMIEDGNNDEHADVWTSFEQSVTYMKEVAAIYQETFRVAGGSNQHSVPATSRKTITKARLDEAQQQAREALELLASNVLNASTAIISTVEAQEASAIATKEQLDGVRDHLRREQHAKEQRRIAEFYSSPLYASPPKSPLGSSTAPPTLHDRLSQKCTPQVQLCPASHACRLLPLTHMLVVVLFVLSDANVGAVQVFDHTLSVMLHIRCLTPHLWEPPICSGCLEILDGTVVHKPPLDGEAATSRSLLHMKSRITGIRMLLCVQMIV